jgi:hypothetical protein
MQIERDQKNSQIAAMETLKHGGTEEAEDN